LKLKLGFERARSTEDLQILAYVVSGLFGGGKEEVSAPKNAVEAKMQFAAMMGKN